MPYILSSILRENFEGLWFEGPPYQKETIYDINSKDPNSPPVNYSAYTLKPHSLPHIETPAHTQKKGETIEHYFKTKSYSHFCGKATVIKLKGNKFRQHPHIKDIKIWEISKEEILEHLKMLTGSEEVPARLIIGLKDPPLDARELHDPDFVLILTQEAADYLTKDDTLKLYGTSWKSSDFMPGKKERPIHNTLFKSALILECLDLNQVPQGNYFLSAFPLPLDKASESPVCPVLFTKDELLESF